MNAEKESSTAEENDIDLKYELFVNCNVNPPGKKKKTTLKLIFKKTVKTSSA